MTAPLPSAKEFYGYKYPEDLTEEQKLAMDKILPLTQKIKDLGTEIDNINREIADKLVQLGISRTTYELYLHHLQVQKNQENNKSIKPKSSGIIARTKEYFLFLIGE